MDTMKLEPLSGRVRFFSDKAVTGSVWGKLIGNLFEKIAKRCESASTDTVIGHIKGLSLFTGEKHIRVSVISGSYPADIESSDGLETDEIEFAINVIVYSLSAKRLESLFKDELRSLQDQTRIKTRIEQLSTQNQIHPKIHKKMPSGWNNTK